MAFLSLFYLPKFKLDPNMLNFNLSSAGYSSPGEKFKGDFVQNFQKSPNTDTQHINVYIVWGSQIDQPNSNRLFADYLDRSRVAVVDIEAKNDANLNQFLDNEMEKNAFDNFNQLFQMCEDVIKSGGDLVSFKRVDCFGNYFERNILNKQAPNNTQIKLTDFKYLKQTLNKNYQNYCDPVVNLGPIERFIRNRKINNQKNKMEDKNLFISCIKWWSLKLYLNELGNSENNGQLDVDSFFGPLFLINRLLPSVYLIKLETDLKASEDFAEMQDNYKRLVCNFFSREKKYNKILKFFLLVVSKFN